MLGSAQHADHFKVTPNLQVPREWLRVLTQQGRKLDIEGAEYAEARTDETNGVWGRCLSIGLSAWTGNSIPHPVSLD